MNTQKEDVTPAIRRALRTAVAKFDTLPAKLAKSSPSARAALMDLVFATAGNFAARHVPEFDITPEAIAAKEKGPDAFFSFVIGQFDKADKRLNGGASTNGEGAESANESVTDIGALKRAVASADAYAIRGLISPPNHGEPGDDIVHEAYAKAVASGASVTEAGDVAVIAYGQWMVAELQ